MALDGKLLAKARDRLNEIKKQHEDEFNLRLDRAYSRAPELRNIDAGLRRLMIELFGVAINNPSARRGIKDIERESLELQEIRGRILAENGMPAAYIDAPDYCPDCGDSGYVMGQMCRCLKALYDEQVSKDLSSLIKLGQESFEKFDLGYYDDFGASEDEASPRQCMEAVFNSCRSYADNFGIRSPSLLLHGGTGLGKTLLSACIARVVAGKGYSVVYESIVSALEAFEVQKFSRDETRAEEASAKARRILECDLMILDDLGTEMSTAFTGSALYTILNSRLITGRKTIISTNLDIQEIKSRYSAQISSRLDGEFWSLSFAGRDIRIIKRDNELA